MINDRGKLHQKLPFSCNCIMYWSTFLLLCSTLATTDTTIDTTLTNNTIVTWLVDDIYQVSLVEPGIIPNFRQIWKKNPDHHQVPSEFLFPEFTRISPFWKESVKGKIDLWNYVVSSHPKKLKLCSGGISFWSGIFLMRKCPDDLIWHCLVFLWSVGINDDLFFPRMFLP